MNYYITTKKGNKALIGHFKDELEAAYIRDQVALQLHGVFARLNILLEDK